MFSRKMQSIFIDLLLFLHSFLSVITFGMYQEINPGVRLTSLKANLYLIKVHNLNSIKMD